jgi:radical SAM enzyme (TIGR01210 family)
VLQQRGAKNLVDPLRAYGAFWEEEPGADLQPVSTATLLLTNAECPFRCVMCDLWQNTLDTPTPSGAIPTQIGTALRELPPARQIKLYNAGSFFDPRQVPLEEDAEIARLISGFEGVIVECHPRFIGERCLRFRDRIDGRLEVAIGLETVHPMALEALNKRMSLDDFHVAARLLRENDIDLRVFLMVQPPFVPVDEVMEWTVRSMEVAFDAGATAVTLIPTRDGNGAMEQLRMAGEWAPLKLRTLERALEIGLDVQRGRVFADDWDIERFFDCVCSPLVAERIRLMNATQLVTASVPCDVCEIHAISCHGIS